MTDSKTYLNVPYAQKDAAKALGAKWDAANKKWYVPADKELALFVKWRTETTFSELPAKAAKPRPPAPASPKSSSLANPAEKGFIAYDGEEAPWD